MANETFSHKRVAEALAILEEEGRKRFKHPEGVPAYQAIGFAIASQTDSPSDFLRLAYEGLEDRNSHFACAVIDWIAPNLHGLVSSQLAYLTALEQERRVRVAFEGKDTDYKVFRMNIEIEEVKETEGEND